MQSPSLAPSSVPPHLGKREINCFQYIKKQTQPNGSWRTTLHYRLLKAFPYHSFKRRTSCVVPHTHTKSCKINTSARMAGSALRGHTRTTTTPLLGGIKKWKKKKTAPFPCTHTQKTCKPYGKDTSRWNRILSPIERQKKENPPFFFHFFPNFFFAHCVVPGQKQTRFLSFQFNLAKTCAVAAAACVCVCV